MGVTNLKIHEEHNNCFCKELCCLCNNVFDADSYTIWECIFGYVCFDCIKKIKEHGSK